MKQRGTDRGFITLFVYSSKCFLVKELKIQVTLTSLLSRLPLDSGAAQ